MRLRNLPLALLSLRLLLAKDVIDAVRDGTYRSYTLAADGKATTRPNYSSLDDSFLPFGQVTSYGYSQRTYGPPPPPPPTTQLHGAELRDALARVHGRLLAPSANRSLPAMLADDRHLGPSAVACVEADGDGGVADAFSGAFGGWPAGGDRAGVGLRSLSKMVAAAAFLALVNTNDHPRLALSTRLGDIFPECATAGHVLAGATVAEALAMRTQGLDNRLNAAWQARKQMSDHAGFPPACDELGLGAEACVAQLVCPAYANHMLERVMLLGVPIVATPCEDASAHCGQWAKKGECKANPGFMRESCARACGECKAGTVLTPEDLGRAAWWAAADANATKQGGIRLMKALKCKYDNYGYVLVDGIVERVTGRPLWRHALELIAAPLGMRDMLRCAKPAAERAAAAAAAGDGAAAEVEAARAGCYALPPNPEATLATEEWQETAGGPTSLSWGCNSLVGSARDLALFLAMLANGGRRGDTRVLRESDVRLLVSEVNDDGSECQGMDTFGFGLGHCAFPDEPRSRCAAPGWYGWGSTHGSRAALLPSRTTLPSSALACVTAFNLATEWGDGGGGGEAGEKRERLGARQHRLAHAQAAALRKLFPLELRRPSSSANFGRRAYPPASVEAALETLDDMWQSKPKA